MGKSDDDNVLNPNKRKRLKYYTSFSDDWIKNPEYSSWLRKLDDKTGRCVNCQTNFTVKWEGEMAIKKHLDSSNHKMIQSNF